MKKMIAVLISLTLLVSSLLCGGAFADENALSVVTTIFPIYDWTREIAGDKIDLTMLLDSGVDLHSFQPTAADIMKIATCDVFIYVGGESDEWVEDALKEAVNPNMKVLSLVELMGEDIKLEELVEGMESDEDEEEEDEEEADEHVWLSLRNARKLSAAIAAALGEADPSNADDYAANAAAYAEKLDALDAEYADVAENAAFSTVLFGDRFPFRYLADDYGLNYYAAFSGCSAESEASFETIAFLAGKVDELGLPVVLTIEGANHRIAETIVQTTRDKNQKILVMDSMQATTGQAVASGVTYLSVMQGNLAALAEALAR
ncbi:MAG: zinc ABC transporter substrate-binding protein [Clostridia bacterium]|nr:zinc ABC transporter substrate-binding protein [Clostridia bacterium]